MDESDNDTPFSAYCPPTEMLIKVCTGDLGDPYAEFAGQHLQNCRRCLLKVSGFRSFLDDVEEDLEDHMAEPLQPVRQAGTATINDWRRTTYNCGDPERQPRCHLVATRRLTLASIGFADSDSTADYEAWIQPIDWSRCRRSQHSPIRADDLEDLAKLLRNASNSAERTITVFLPAEVAWLVEPFLLEDTGKWRLFVADTTPQGRPRRPLMKCNDEISGVRCYQVETWPEEGVRMSRWLIDKQGIFAGRLAGMTFAALGRVLGRGDSEHFVPADDPLMVVVPADDSPVDDAELFAMYAQGHRDLVSTP